MRKSQGLKRIIFAFISPFFMVFAQIRGVRVVHKAYSAAPGREVGSIMTKNTNNNCIFLKSVI